MANVIVIAVLVLILGFAVRYIHTEKKRGVKCIGCPAGCSCSGNCSGAGGACGCSCGANQE